LESEPDHQIKMMENAFRAIRQACGGKPGRRIRKPLAVCISKMDLLSSKTGPRAASHIPKVQEVLRGLGDRPRAVSLSRAALQQQSRLTADVCRVLWPKWDVERQVCEQFGGPSLFFPMTALGLEPPGIRLEQRAFAPVGLLDPLLWLLAQHGYRALN
jgi:hypothetical protein